MFGLNFDDEQLILKEISIFHHAEGMEGDARRSIYSSKTFYYSVDMLCFNHSIHTVSRKL